MLQSTILTMRGQRHLRGWVRPRPGSGVTCIALLGVSLVVTPPAGAGVYVPPGFEIVQLTNDANDDRYVGMNNCGEVVHSHYLLPSGAGRAIFCHDNGRVIRVTPDASYNYTPDINDEGMIVWSGKPTLQGVEHIFLYDNGVATQLTSTQRYDYCPSVNNLGHLTWYRWFQDGCEGSHCEVFFYDGGSIIQLSDNGFSNQSGSINDYDEVVWTRYNDCVNPWVSDILLYGDGMTSVLPGPEPPAEPQIPAINNLGHVVWGSSAGIELWADESTTLITPWGRNPAINNHGDIFFLRWHDDSNTWQVWAHLNGMFYQLSDDPFWSTDGDINDYGEMAWEMGPWEQRDVRMLRRIRNGDTDFDLDVDMDDYAPWAGCLTGPVETDRLCHCRFLDMDHDRDVDLADFALFQNAMGTVVTIDDHNCCAAHYDPGCTHPDIMACVCAALPECCETTWTAACAAAVTSLGCGECP
ncbi:MAG TPA: hypothetical protein PKK06_10185 [Phycisphaerae bacterium]|nr:hypothetical protein [Phycisphaerae bacterium]HNU45731.1 hypothetical protein [Phycisphaerae bacterium]